MKTNAMQLINKLGREFGIVIALFVIVAIFSAIDSQYFTVANLVDIIDQSTINGLLAIGITDKPVAIH